MSDQLALYMASMGMPMSEQLKCRLDRMAQNAKIGTGQPKPVTKSGARKKPKDDSRGQARRKKAEAARREQLKKGKFFLRAVSRVAQEQSGRAGTTFTQVIVKVFKILDGELWIRRNHKNAEDHDPAEWSKAKNAKPERLNQEIRQVAGYLESREMLEEDCEVILDLLYFHLENAL